MLHVCFNKLIYLLSYLLTYLLSASEMTYIVSSGALNSTHSLTTYLLAYLLTL